MKRILFALFSFMLVFAFSGCVELEECILPEILLNPLNYDIDLNNI